MYSLYEKKMLRSATSERAVLVAKVSHQYLIAYDLLLLT